jgi:hypothetical protein
VALTEKHRNTIYQYLAPAWGDEVTQAFLSQFPAREGEEPITRDFLRAELAELRGELRAEMSDWGNGLRAEIADQGISLRAEMADQGASLRAEMAELRAELNRQGSRLAGLVIAVAGVLTAVIALT